MDERRELVIAGAGDDVDQAPLQRGVVAAAAEAALEEVPIAAVDAAAVVADAPPPVPEATGFREAVLLLEDPHDRTPIDNLEVVDIRGNDGPSFRAFVDSLGKREGGHRAVRFISFQVNWRGLPNEAAVRLFRDALPAHPTLESIDINIWNLPGSHLQRLTEAVPTESGNWLLLCLRFSDHRITAGAIDQENYQENIQAMVAMLDRQVALAELVVNFHWDPNHGSLIFQAAARNLNLLSFHLYVPEIGADALDGLRTSSFRNLCLMGKFSEESVSSLARSLRTNVTLETMDLMSIGIHSGHQDPSALLELVRRYNYTLRRISGTVGFLQFAVRVQFEQYWERNAWIRRALTKLQNLKENMERVRSRREERNARDRRFRARLGLPPPVEEEQHDEDALPPQLLERLLIRVSDVPTVLYRIMKMGYVNQVSDHLVAAQAEDDGGDGRRVRRRLD